MAMGSKQGGAQVLTELNVTIEETVSVIPRNYPRIQAPSSSAILTWSATISQLEVHELVDSVHIYPASPEIQPKETYSVADRIKKGLSKALVHYDILAGRFRVNEELKRLEFHRNYAGVPFSTASCHALTLEDLGDLSTPTPFFRSFLPPRQNATNKSDIPLLIQATTFKCGGFVLGLTIAHGLLDGLSIGELLNNLLCLAQDGPLVIAPLVDRTMLTARDNPQVNSDDPYHVAFHEFLNASAREHDIKAQSKSLITQFFSFTAGDLVTLRRSATEGGVVSIASRFDALAAHIWKAYTRANESKPTQVSRLVYAVDIRNRMEPPLPKGFVGNGIASAFASATCEEIRERPLSFCVGLIQKANKRITNDYVRSAIDYFQTNLGEESTLSEFRSLTTWAKLPIHSIEFEGRLPIYAGPILETCPNDITIFHGFGSNAGGLNLLLKMNTDAMGKFRKYVKVSEIIETKLHQSFPQSKL